MKKRLCPVCDGEMKWGHFCFGCRQWIREPKIVEVNYYLNESHPKWETACLYHNGPEAAVRERKAAAEEGRKKTGRPRTKAGERKRRRERDEKKERNQSTGKLTVMAVLAIYAVLVFVLPLVSDLLSFVRQFFRLF